MKILALIPARGGSKRVPGKNIKALGGMPLIGWSIKAAHESKVCTCVHVSTDDEDIAAVSRQYGAYVPGLRPAHLATDTAGSVDVAIHALDVYEAEFGEVDGLLLLQPTSPFRTSATIRRAIELYAEYNGLHPVVSVSAASCHPAWCFRTKEGGMEPFLGWDMIGQRSQDLEPAWMLNGAIYVIAPSRLRTERKFLTPDTQPLIMESAQEAIDIDTPADWAAAEALLQ